MSLPYDIEEDHLFNMSNKSASSNQTNLPTISQIFDRIRVLINNSGSGISETSSLNSTILTNQAIASLKADAQRPFSVILKHIIISGINGFDSGTNGKIKNVSFFINYNLIKSISIY